MRWIAFIILIYVATVFQTTVAPFVAIHGVRPDVLIIIGVYYALMAARYDAFLAAWSIGLLVDLTSVGYRVHSNVGVCAVAYSIAAMMIVGLREYTFRDTPVAHVLYCFGAKLVVSAVVIAHMSAVGNASVPIGGTVALALWEASYTAILAPYVCWILKRLQPGLGLTGSRRLLHN